MNNNDLLGESEKEGYVCVPYEEKNAGLASEFKMEHRCDRWSSVKDGGDERCGWS